MNRVVAAARPVLIGAILALTVPEAAYLETAPTAPVPLDSGQAWDEATRNAWYHESQHSKIVPFSWFMALKEKNGSRYFRDGALLEQYGFISDPVSATNPDGLP